MVKVSVITGETGFGHRRGDGRSGYPGPVKEWMKVFGAKGSVSVCADGGGW